MNSLAGSIPSRRSRRLAIGLASALAGMSLLALPFARTTLTASPTFLTISLALAASADGVTAYLFLSQARIGRSVPLMLLASGYFYSALAIVMHMLLFPGIFSPEGLLGAGAQSADWSWVWWHGGFPLFVIGYAIAHRRDLERVGDPRFSPPVVAVFAFVVVAIVASLGVLTLRGEHLLPAIVQRDRYDLLLSTGVGPLVMLSIVCALAALLRFTRLRTVTDLWLAVALFASRFSPATATRSDGISLASRVSSLRPSCCSRSSARSTVFSHVSRFCRASTNSRAWRTGARSLKIWRLRSRWPLARISPSRC